MLKRRILLTIAFLYSLNFINSAQIDYMCVKLKGDFTKSYKIDDVRKVIFPTKKEMGIVPYIGEVVIYSLDDLVRVLFTDASDENILYVDEDMLMDESSSYDAVVIAENGNSDIYLDIENTTLTAGSVLMYVNEVGVAPKINVRGSGALSTNKFVVSRLIKSDIWTMISLPYDVQISEITVNGSPAIVGENIIFREYDGERRASQSKEGMTVSGWKSKNGGVLPANIGFAVAINSDYGEVQEVRFPSSNIVIDASSVTLPLNRHYSTVNKGVDADWNFVGNPTLSLQEKEMGYSVYIYNSEKDSYDEYSSQQSVQYSPFSSFFVQSQDGFTDILFSQSVARSFKSANLNSGVVELTINDDDKLTLLLNEDSDNEYVRNEDALYMSPNNSELSQIYMIRNGVKMAVSEQPTFDEEVTVGFIAPKGVQAITVTRLPENVGLVLIDKTLDSEEVMLEGDSYEFNNTTTTNNSRFVLRFTELTGVEVEDSNSHQIVVSGDRIYVKGCNIGEVISLYSSTGTLLNQTISQNNITELRTLAQGVLVVKIDDKVYKVVKR